MQSQGNFVQMLLKHLDTAAIKNAIVRLLTYDVGDSVRSRIVEVMFSF